MNHQNILKQSWHILRSYRLLWLLGFALALTTCSWQGASGLGGRFDNDQKLTIKSEGLNLVIPGFEGTVELSPGGRLQIILPYEDGQPLVITHQEEWSADLPPSLEQDMRDVNKWLRGELPPDVSDVVTGSIVIILTVVVAIFLLATAVRCVANAALIRAVDYRAKTGQKASPSQTLGMGFSRAAWRFFLIDLVIRLPFLLLFLALLVLSLASISLWSAGSTTGILFGITAAGLLFTSVLFLAVVVNAMLSVLIALIRRACALEDLTVFGAIGRGFRLLRHNLRDVAVMAASLIVVTVMWLILLVPVTLVLIPVLLVCIALGGLAAVAVLFPLAGLASLAMGPVLALVLAGSIALAVFIPIVGAPFFFLHGLLHVYTSTAWTLTYRELRVTERVAVQMTPKVALDGA